MSYEEECCLQSYFLCRIPDSGYVSETWLLKQAPQQISKPTVIEWPKEPQRKTDIGAFIPYGLWIIIQGQFWLGLQGLRFHINAHLSFPEDSFVSSTRDHITWALRQDKYESEGITCKAEPGLLADLEAISRKQAEKVTEQEVTLYIVRSKEIFNRFWKWPFRIAIEPLESSCRIES